MCVSVFDLMSAVAAPVLQFDITFVTQRVCQMRCGVIVMMSKVIIEIICYPKAIFLLCVNLGPLSTFSENLLSSPASVFVPVPSGGDEQVVLRSPSRRWATWSVKPDRYWSEAKPSIAQ